MRMRGLGHPIYLDQTELSPFIQSTAAAGSAEATFDCDNTMDSVVKSKQGKSVAAVPVYPA